MSTLERYSFGRVIVDGHEHTRDVIVLPDRVIANWRRREGHRLRLEDLREVLERPPQHLIVGCGAEGRLEPDAAALAALTRRGVHVEVLRTGRAVQRYGELDERATAAALHLTC
jgi:hypothetical protein